MDLALAKTFLAISETGSFVAAAERLHITQSTVSSRMRTLEQLIGKSLMERSKSGAVLTPAGQQFHKHALALLRVWEHARLEVGLAAKHCDHLAVGGQVSLWDGFLLNWIAQVKARVPDLAITASFGFSPGLMDRLLEGTLDVGIMYRPANRPSLIVEHLFDEELILVASDSAATIERISAQARDDHWDGDYVFVNWGPEFQADHAQALPELSPPSLTLDLGTLGINYLLANNAAGYFPARIIGAHIATGALYKVPHAPRFVYPAYAVYPQEHDPDAYGPLLSELRQMAQAL